MIRFFIFTLSIYSINAFACISPASKVNLANTSQANHPLTIVGSKIYFDKNTTDEFYIEYDLKQKKWCTSDINVGCLLDGTEGNVVMLGLKETRPLFVTRQNKDYAKIEIKEPHLMIYTLDSKGNKISNSYIQFTDSSDASIASLKARTSTGGEAMFKRRKGLRSLAKVAPKVIDLTSSKTVVAGCGAKASTPPTKHNSPARSSR